MKRQIKLSILFAAVFWRKLMEYRIDFLIGISGFFLNSVATVVFVWLIFKNIPRLKGYAFEEILFVYGLSLIPKGIDHVFTDNVWELSRKLIVRGEFFKHLIRPINPLFSLISERFIYPDGLGEVITGVVVVGYSWQKLNLDLSVFQIITIPILLLATALIFFSLKLMIASLAFWTQSSFTTLMTVYNFSNYTRFPIDIYNTPVKFLLCWIIPFAFTAHFPARYLMYGDMAALAGCILVSLVFFCLSYAVWRLGLKNYEATGT